MSTHPPRAVVIGGSLVGLIAGNLLLRRGWDVHVYERVTGSLVGRGAGITLLPGALEALRAAGVAETATAFGIDLPRRCVVDARGDIVAQHEFVQGMTSWGRLHEALLEVFPADRYHAGQSLQRIEHDADGALAIFEDGHEHRADLVVGADGLRSTVRAQYLPNDPPRYAGYVAWRCLTEERVLPPEMAPYLERYTLCLVPGAQVIAYPVPGAGHEYRRGLRQFNIVWYHPVADGEDLRRYLSTDDGRYFPNGIPPALIAQPLREEMVARANAILAPPIALAWRLAKQHFFQAIYDLEPPHLAFERVALVGDAAFVVRPHTAMGVTKGAGDVFALLRALDAHPRDVPGALLHYERERLPVGRVIAARGRELGRYMQAQTASAEARAAAEAERDLVQVMLDTAAPIDYEALAAREQSIG